MARRENQNRNDEPKKGRYNRQHRSRQSSDPLHSGSNQDGHHYPGQESKSLGPHEKNFCIIVDSVPYVIKAIPFSFNDEIRYRVSFNGSPEHVFTWDSSLSQLRAIDDDSATMPDNSEIAISEKLQS